MPSVVQRANSKRIEAFWPTSAVRKFFNLRNDANQFSADEDEEDAGHRLGNRRNFNLRRYSESGVSQTHFTDSQNFSIFVGTWNVAGKPPADSMDLKEWFDVREEVDIYVIGFQEIVPLNPGNVLGAEDEGPATKWDAIIRKTLNGESRQTKSAPASPWRDDEDDENEDESPDYTEGETYAEKMKHKKAHSISGGLDFNSLKLAAGDEPGASSGKKSKFSYLRMISKQMVGIFITVWVRKDLRHLIHDVKVSCVGCGLMGYYGNKGSISVSMTFDQTSFCFVCTHLTSGEREGDELRRNSDVIEILRRTAFPKSNNETSPANILAHDRIIWLGDLNYRLSLRNGETKELLDDENWNALLRKDQLKDEQKAGGVFHGWHEGVIEFAPTYKYKANSTEYSNWGEKQRTPAWCDRVLWKGKGLKQIDYFRTEYTFSDHRPVTALFFAEVDLLKRRGTMRRASEDASAALDFQLGGLGRFSKEINRRTDPFLLAEFAAST